MDDAAILRAAASMLADGADILDIGGQSTRPGAEEVGAEVELKRVLGPIEALRREFPEAILSIDTWYSVVARAAVDAGAAMVNDISGGHLDPAMLETVGRMGDVPYICMHMKGRPSTMNQHALYSDVVGEVLDYFSGRLDACRAAGIHDCIVDPGMGFAKNAAQNMALLKNLDILRILGRPILLGVSRKSTIYKTLGITAAEALNGTTVLHTLGLLNGASILRVHDPKEAREAIMLMEAYKKA